MPHLVTLCSKACGAGPEKIVEIMKNQSDFGKSLMFSGRKTYRAVLNIAEIICLVPAVALSLSRELPHKVFRDTASFREHVSKLFNFTARLPEVSTVLVQESVRLGKNIANTNRRLEFHSLQMCMDMFLESTSDVHVLVAANIG